MEEDNFIGYLGDFRIHDSRIIELKSNQDTLLVSLKSEDNEIIIIRFIGVKSVNYNKPEDMIIFALCELKYQLPNRKFVFVNTLDNSPLEIIAEDYTIFNTESKS